MARRVLEDFALVLGLVPGLSRWTAAEKQALVRILRAKAGPEESRFLDRRRQPRQRGFRCVGGRRDPRALRLDDAQARSALAQLLAERGDAAGSVALLAEALRLDPSDAWLRLRLADLLVSSPNSSYYSYATEACITSEGTVDLDHVTVTRCGGSGVHARALSMRCTTKGPA